MEHFDDVNNESGEAALEKSKVKLGYFDRILYFYKAPFVKFITNVVSTSVKVEKWFQISNF